jgi:hypothetical protein
MLKMSKKLYVSMLPGTLAKLFLFGIPALWLLDTYKIPRNMGIDNKR